LFLEAFGGFALEPVSEIPMGESDAGNFTHSKDLLLYPSAPQNPKILTDEQISAFSCPASSKVVVHSNGRQCALGFCHTFD
jgi:hypothetical protein